jgi:hypothetical protein
MMSVGGCCGLSDSAAADDAAPPLSTAPIAAVGGCSEVEPEVGPDPASFDASSFVRLSISFEHGPAPADAAGKAKIAAPITNTVIFIAHSPGFGIAH